MKTLFIYFFFCFFALMANAQKIDLSGTWTGFLGQNDKDYQFALTMEFQQNENVITGTARATSLDGKSSYVLYKISGYVNANSLILNDISVITEGNLPSSWYWCKKIYLGNLQVDQDSLYINGSWKNDGGTVFYKGEKMENMPCAPGNFKISKALPVQQPLPVEKARPVTVAAKLPAKEIQNTVKLNKPYASTPFKSRKTEIKELIEVASDELLVQFYDDAQVDNDTISVYYNRVQVLKNKRLSFSPINLKINVTPGRDNELLMFAENEGTIGENTAKVIFSDRGTRREISIHSNRKSSHVLVFRKSSSGKK